MTSPRSTTFPKRTTPVRCLANLGIPLEEEVRAHLERPGRSIYFAMGSSGNKELYLRALGALARTRLQRRGGVHDHLARGRAPVRRGERPAREVRARGDRQQDGRHGRSARRPRHFLHRSLLGTAGDRHPDAARAAVQHRHPGTERIGHPSIQAALPGRSSSRAQSRRSWRITRAIGPEPKRWRNASR